MVNALLVHNMKGCGFKVSKVNRHLSQIMLINIPSKSLHCRELAGGRGGGGEEEKMNVSKEAACSCYSVEYTMYMLFACTCAMQVYNVLHMKNQTTYMLIPQYEYHRVEVLIFLLLKISQNKFASV